MAESFGVDPDRYDRTRPAYPEALIQRLLAEAPGTDVLDVGCGTGTEARQLAEAGCSVLGVEPDVRMAEYARHRSGLQVEVERFETWEPHGRRFDLVVAGTAWHWVDPFAGARRAAEALRPDGLLAPFWHVPELPQPIADVLARAFRQAVANAGRASAASTGMAAYRRILDQSAAGMKKTPGLAAPEEWIYPWSRTYTREEWLDQMPTTGPLTRLPVDQRDAVLAAVGDAIDDLGGMLTVPYTTVAVTARKAR